MCIIDRVLHKIHKMKLRPINSILYHFETDLTVPIVPNRGFGTSTHISKTARHILMKLSSYV